eukprot:TRINITY_DN163_c0_g1_i4.p1 TRINITY_DN163_c0_g1~~TRINITY_DN163_c0_g1_i4.p1  ORF type:complete len:752 (-),score=327.68 TRINITY_DN163_c0_g1_i4:381-2636(-)
MASFQYAFAEPRVHSTPSSQTASITNNNFASPPVTCNGLIKMETTEATYYQQQQQQQSGSFHQQGASGSVDLSATSSAASPHGGLRPSDIGSISSYLSLLDEASAHASNSQTFNNNNNNSGSNQYYSQQQQQQHTIPSPVGSSSDARDSTDAYHSKFGSTPSQQQQQQQQLSVDCYASRFVDSVFESGNLMGSSHAYMCGVYEDHQRSYPPPPPSSHQQYLLQAQQQQQQQQYEQSRQSSFPSMAQQHQHHQMTLSMPVTMSLHGSQYGSTQVQNYLPSMQVPFGLTPASLMTPQSPPPSTANSTALSLSPDVSERGEKNHNYRLFINHLWLTSRKFHKGGFKGTRGRNHINIFVKDNWDQIPNVNCQVQPIFQLQDDDDANNVHVDFEPPIVEIQNGRGQFEAFFSKKGEFLIILKPVGLSPPSSSTTTTTIIRSPSSPSPNSPSSATNLDPLSISPYIWHASVTRSFGNRHDPQKSRMVFPTPGSALSEDQSNNVYSLKPSITDKWTFFFQQNIEPNLRGRDTLCRITGHNYSTFDRIIKTGIETCGSLGRDIEDVRLMMVLILVWEEQPNKYAILNAGVTSNISQFLGVTATKFSQEASQVWANAVMRAIGEDGLQAFYGRMMHLVSNRPSEPLSMTYYFTDEASQQHLVSDKFGYLCYVSPSSQPSPSSSSSSSSSPASPTGEQPAPVSQTKGVHALYLLLEDFTNCATKPQPDFKHERNNYPPVRFEPSTYWAFLSLVRPPTSSRR